MSDEVGTAFQADAFQDDAFQVGGAVPTVIVGTRKRPRVVYRESEKYPWEKEERQERKPEPIPLVFHVALSATMAPAIASVLVHTPTETGIVAVAAPFNPTASISVMQTDPWADEAEEELLLVSMMLNGDL